MNKLKALAAVAVLGLAGCSSSTPLAKATPAPTVAVTVESTPTPTQPAPTTSASAPAAAALDLATDAGLCAADAELSNLELNDAIAPLLGYSAVRDERTLKQDDAIRAYKNAAFTRACPARAS